jgi:hypothetical protein
MQGPSTISASLVCIPVEELMSIPRERLSEAYILYEKESLLSPLPNNIIWNRMQLLCQIIRQKFVFALQNQILEN